MLLDETLYQAVAKIKGFMAKYDTDSCVRISLDKGREISVEFPQLDEKGDPDRECETHDHATIGEIVEDMEGYMEMHDTRCFHRYMNLSDEPKNVYACIRVKHIGEENDCGNSENGGHA